jgi:hypothetical protein
MQMNQALRFVLLALGCLAAAALLRCALAPLLTQLPHNYADERRYTVVSNFRASMADEWEAVTLTGRRLDQALVTSGNVAIVQGDLYWTTATGKAIFESSGLYGVDRTTRQNRPGFGDFDRLGQYLFPLHVQPIPYDYWDQNFIGQRAARYIRTESVEEEETYVFDFSGAAMDETAGYSQLPGVPERYFTYTDGKGTLWVEPLSGTVVDYAEEGESYFVDRATGTRLANFYEWEARYTTETRAAQLALARTARLRIVLLEVWLPGALLLAGATLLVAALPMAWRHRSVRPISQNAETSP